MNSYKKVFQVILAIFILSMVFIPGFAAPLVDQQGTEPTVSQVEKSEAVNRSARIEPADDGMVEILILLKEKADTKAAALEIRKEQAPSIGPAPGFNKDLKDDIAIAVVDALQITAKRTQAPLLRYLETERASGRVDEYKGYFIVNLVFARVAEELVDEIAGRPEVDSIMPNQRIKLIEPIKGTERLQTTDIEWNITQVNAPEVWAEDIYGSGVVIGIIDTGVDMGHDTLLHKYRGYVSGGTHIHDYNWFDPYHKTVQPDDFHGHGTHCTGIMLGSDSEGNNQIGVAPGAQWIAARGLDDDGSGTARYLLDSAEYLLAPSPNPDGSGDVDPTKAPDIINNSWGSDPGFDEWFMVMVQAWRDAGILPVFAAGNKGPDSPTIGIPANYPNTFSVAATDTDKNLAHFSSRGPAPYRSPDNMQPHISAPGDGIRSALPDNKYGSLNGTSMAAPHISGVAALLLELDPDLTVAELENKIMNSAESLTDETYPESPNFGFGYGLVDALAALDAISTPPAELTLIPSETAYAWNIEELGSGLPEGPVTVEIPTGFLDTISDFDGFWMSGADFVNSTWYAVSYENEPGLYTVDTATGDHTLVGKTGISGGSTGLAYDPVGQTLYFSAVIDDDSNLYTINIETGSAELVGRIVSDQFIGGIAADGSGNLYGLNLHDNSLYSIDKTNGEGTSIGKIGININFAQDIAYDRDSGILYGTLFDGDTFQGGLYQLNTDNGAASLLQYFGSQVGGFAIPLSKTITVTSNPPEGGNVSGGGIYVHGVEATLVATNNPGYIFINWTEDDTEVYNQPEYTFEVIEDRTLMANFDANPTFSDVPVDHPFFTEIEALAASGIAEGWPDGTFRPSANVTRMAMAAFLYRGLVLADPGVTVPTFSDVPVDHPFFSEIEALAASGITTGYPDGTFRPSANVTRMAMAAFLYRGLELGGPND